MSIQRARAALPVLFGGGASSSLLTDLQVYYLLTEASGTRADSVGSVDLTDSGSVGSGDGPGGDLGTAAQFDGTNELTSTDAVHQVSDATFTIAFWLYYPTAGASSFCMGKMGGTADEYRLWILGSAPRFYLYEGGNSRNVATADTMSNATWHAVRMWFDSANDLFGVQLDGGTNTSAAYTWTPNTSNGVFWLGGADGSGNAPSGSRIAGYGRWSRLLTDDEWDTFRATPPVGYPF